MSGSKESEAQTASSTVGAAVEGIKNLGLAAGDAVGRAAAAVVGGVTPTPSSPDSSTAPPPASSSAPAPADSTVGQPDRRDINLQEYGALQQRIAQLQGMQIAAHVAYARRSEESLQRRLAALKELEAAAQQAQHKAEAQSEKLGAGKWYPGKLLMQNQSKKLEASQHAEEEATEQLKQRQAQVAELAAQLQSVQKRREQLEVQEGELTVALAHAEVLEERLFGTPAPDASPRHLELIDALCAMDGEEEEGWSSEGATSEGAAAEKEGEGGRAAAGTKGPADQAAQKPAADGGQEGPAVQASEAAKADKFGGWARGRLLRMVASKLGKPEKGDKDEYGRYLHGRLLRITADKLEEALRGGALEVEVAGQGEVELEVEGRSFKLEEVEEQGKQGGKQEDKAVPEARKGRGLGEGGVLRSVADKLGKADPLKHKDAFGGYGRGRLLRITADKLQRAAAARRKERDAAMRKVAGGIGAHPDDQAAALDDEEFKRLFPPWACSFNPALHCPPSTFLWTYNNRFMGRLQKIRTGDTVHAFYRFGPFGSSALDGTSSGSPLRRMLTAQLSRRAGGGSSSDGLPLLMLSGLGSTMIAWGVPLMRALSISHEVIIMDYRGAGLSKYYGSDPWDYFKQAEAVLMLADALNMPKFNWVGWSSGGDVGLVLAALHGQRLGRMVSHAGVAGGKNTIAPPALKFLDPDAKVSVGQTMALVFPPDDPKDFRRTCAQYIKEVYSMPKSIVDQEVGRQAAREQYKADEEFVAHEEQVWEALPRVTVPCLITNGTRDVLVPKENAERLAARIPGAKLHLFEGWGHAWKDSGAFAAVIDDFLCGSGDAGGA